MGANASIDEKEPHSDAMPGKTSLTLTEEAELTNDTDENDSDIETATKQSNLQSEKNLTMSKNETKYAKMTDQETSEIESAMANLTLEQSRVDVIQASELEESSQYIDDDTTTLHDSPLHKACSDLDDVSLGNTVRTSLADPIRETVDTDLKEVLEKWSKGVMAADEDATPQKPYAFACKRNFQFTYKVLDVVTKTKATVDEAREVYHDSEQHHESDSSVSSSQSDLQKTISEDEGELKNIRPSRSLEFRVTQLGESDKSDESFVDDLHSSSSKTDQDEKTKSPSRELGKYADNDITESDSVLTSHESNATATSYREELRVLQEDTTVEQDFTLPTEVEGPSGIDTVERHRGLTQQLPFDPSGSILGTASLAQMETSTRQRDPEVLHPILTMNDLRKMRFESLRRHRDLISKHVSMLQHNYERKQTPQEVSRGPVEGQTVVRLEQEIERLKQSNEQLRHNNEKHRAKLALTNDRNKVLEIKCARLGEDSALTDVGGTVRADGLKDLKYKHDQEPEALKQLLVAFGDEIKKLKVVIVKRNEKIERLKQAAAINEHTTQNEKLAANNATLEATTRVLNHLQRKQPSVSEQKTVRVNGGKEGLGELDTLRSRCKIMKRVIDTLTAEKTLLEDKLERSNLAYKAQMQQAEDRPKEVGQLKKRQNHKEGDVQRLEVELREAKHTVISQCEELAIVQRQNVALKLSVETAIGERLAVQKQLAAILRNSPKDLTDKDRELNDKNRELAVKNRTITELQKSVSDLLQLEQKVTEERQKNGKLSKEFGDLRRYGQSQTDLQKKLTAANQQAGRLGNELGKERKIKDCMESLLDELQPLIEKEYSTRPSNEVLQRRGDLRAMFRRYGYNYQMEYRGQ